MILDNVLSHLDDGFMMHQVKHVYHLFTVDVEETKTVLNHMIFA